MKKNIPVRKCIGCGARKNKVELLRLVKNKEQILIDPRGNLPGRGAYICPGEKCIEKAKKKNSFKKALKTSIPDNFYKEILEEIDNE